MIEELLEGSAVSFTVNCVRLVTYTHNLYVYIEADSRNAA